jgi:hypothetical protein
MGCLCGGLNPQLHTRGDALSLPSIAGMPAASSKHWRRPAELEAGSLAAGARFPRS